MLKLMITRVSTRPAIMVGDIEVLRPAPKKSLNIGSRKWLRPYATMPMPTKSIETLSTTVIRIYGIDTIIGV